MPDALILTPEQAAALVAANDPSTNRRIEPRTLEDGTIILNADVLDDPLFSDPAKPWRTVLDEIPIPKADAPTLAQLDAADFLARAAKEAAIQQESAQ
jgi:hypothetical protein